MMTFDDQKLSGWGRAPVIDARVMQPTTRGDLDELFEGAPARPLIPHGMGRSYGDAALLEDGRVLLTRKLDRVLDFDPNTGRILCEAGVTLAHLIEAYLPQGFFPPVVPGTRYVSVGGAVGCNIHGKNHHLDGCFGDHICALEVMLGSGEIVRCTPDEEPELFWATIGGMGLTGLILTVDFCLTAVPSRAIDLETVRVEHLDHFFEASAASSDFTHVVSWVDTVKSGRAMGRGVLMRGRHAQRAQRVSVGAVDRMAGLLGKMVDGKGFHSNALLNRATISMFNEAYFRKEKKGSAHSRVDIIPFFFPLDAVSNWNYVYGPRGFYQYQFVVPERDAVRAALAEVTSSGQYSFLSVIKEFGDRDHGGLSFPTKGVTLAMDFPNTGDDLLGLFERLDAIVVEAGGRVYMGKDARLPAHRMRQMYPEWERWKAVRDQYDPGRVFRSELGLRLELV